jgi:protein O-GlcNAc transferase
LRQHFSQARAHRGCTCDLQSDHRRTARCSRAAFQSGQYFEAARRPGEAAEAFRRALVLQPNFPEAYTNLGNVLQRLEAYHEAVAAYRQALALRPDLADVHGNLGAAYENLGERQEAIDSYRAAIALNPKLLAIRTWINHKRRQICDWDGIEAEEAEILNLLVEDGSEAVHPFAVLSMGANALLQMRAAHAFAENFKAPAFEHRREDFAGARKLKIGYLSSDLCRHATALLMAELFERHD